MFTLFYSNGVVSITVFDIFWASDSTASFRFAEYSIMASQTAGIMQLLTAEKRAAEKINEARKRKTQRLKQAKQEAQAEVEKYRQASVASRSARLMFDDRERQFKEYEQQYLGTKEDIESGIIRETEAELQSMQRNVAQNKQQVIVRLLQLVCDIRPELHHNLQLQKKLDQ
ncbi:V-type proton ATPase subunit G [Aphelenchoides besseyi]|nr:V-type proton ATPase subunit G [Aphelenchoides besseyi]